jgi:putative phosphoribosyl transferase
VTFTVDEHTLHGHLNVPDEAGAVIIFAHGSGSSRLSPRNRKVAEHLNHAGFGTFLFDLLDEGEAWDRQNVFDIPLLARRLVAATMWLREWPACRGIPFGYFGASTGAAAALTAAAEETSDVYAVVSRGGRPDLVPSRRLGAVRAPTLLIVGENDHPVREANVEVATHIRSAHRVEIVPGATHLFEEPGALSQVANLAASWFRQHLHTDLVASTPSAGAGD